MQVQLVVYLEAWEKDKKYDRLGSDDAMVEIANVDVPQIRIPVKTGRNVAIIFSFYSPEFSSIKRVKRSSNVFVAS
jgi:HPr kinase/phosphorylase